MLVIPCFNEVGRLRRAAFEAFLDERRDWGLLFVDDGSRDGTWAILEAMGKRHPEQVRTLRLERNSGKAEAVRRGMLEAPWNDLAYLGYWDADLAAPLSELDGFLRILEQRREVAAVLGSRVRMLGHTVVRSRRRYLLGRIFAACAAKLLQLPVYDPQCGAKLFRASARVRALFQQPFCSNWAFDVELLARMVASGADLGSGGCVYELPLSEWRDVGGSKLRHLGGTQALADLWRIRRRYPRRLARRSHGAGS